MQALLLLDVAGGYFSINSNIQRMDNRFIDNNSLYEDFFLGSS